jgi:hypothetical protein
MDQLLECTAILTECMTSHFAESEQKLFSLPMDPSATNSVQVSLLQTILFEFLNTFE